MTWIKRNLFFLIGAVIAVALMGCAGWYLFQKTRLYNLKKEELNQAYAELKRLYDLKPNPGSEKVNNIQIAKQEQAGVRNYLGKAREYFQPIAPIPPVEGTNKVSDREFAAELRKTVDLLQRDAQNNSVSLPPRYYFSFDAVKTRISFPAGSLEPLSAQLGEIKAISDVLIRAKVNALDSIRRERVSVLDMEAQADYIEDKSVTTDMAVIRPYEITFRCFSPELAGVISGFAKSTYGFIIKAMNIEPAVMMAGTDLQGQFAAPVASQPMVETARPRYNDDEAPRYVAPVAPAATYAASQRGNAPVINERLLKVTVRLDIVKLKPEGAK